MYGLVQNRDLDQNSIGTKNVCSLRLSTGYSLKKDLIDLVQKLTIALTKRTLVIRRPEYWTPRRRPRGVPKLCSWMLAPQFGCIMVFSYRHCVKNWKIRYSVTVRSLESKLFSTLKLFKRLTTWSGCQCSDNFSRSKNITDRQQWSPSC